MLEPAAKNGFSYRSVLCNVILRYAAASLAQGGRDSFGYSLMVNGDGRPKNRF